MWKITFVHKISTYNIKEVDVQFFESPRDTLIKHICPLLSKHVKVLNKQSKHLNSSDATYMYIITDVHYLNSAEAEHYYQGKITESVEYYNKTVISKNKLIKFSNRIANRPIEEGLLNTIDIKDYINPFNDGVTIIVESDKIIVN